MSLAKFADSPACAMIFTRSSGAVTDLATAPLRPPAITNIALFVAGLWMKLVDGTSTVVPSPLRRTASPLTELLATSSEISHRKGRTAMSEIQIAPGAPCRQPPKLWAI